MDDARLEELIQFHKQNMQQMEMVADMFGGAGNPMVGLTKNIATKNIQDTIAALEDYKAMRQVKGLLDGKD